MIYFSTKLRFLSTENDPAFTTDDRNSTVRLFGVKPLRPEYIFFNFLTNKRLFSGDGSEYGELGMDVPGGVEIRLHELVRLGEIDGSEFLFADAHDFFDLLAAVLDLSLRDLFAEVG